MINSTVLGCECFIIDIPTDFRFWIDTFPVHFDLNTKLSEAVSKFKDVIMKQDDNEALTQLVDISKM